MNDYEKLLSYSNAILKEGDFHDELAPAVMGYADLLFSITNIDGNLAAHRSHIDTANGNAIGTFWAARCVMEIFRTQRFVKSLAAAIKDIKNTKPQEAVHILYAGTGPFAALALPIMATHLPADVQFTLLEINPESYSMLKVVLEKFNFNAFVSKTELNDATIWKLENQHFDIVLSETMDRALIKEPQVSIMLNIASQLKNETPIFIPEEIVVSVSARRQNETDKKHLINLISFNKHYMFNLIRKSEKGQWDFEEIGLSFNADDKLYFETEITVYKDYKLIGNDCSLNFSAPIKLDQPKDHLTFRYTNVSMPGFHFK